MERVNEHVLAEAEFDQRVCVYWLVCGAMVFTFTIVGVVLLPIWFVLGLVLTRRYLKRLSCTLTNRRLVVRKGWLVRVEKAIPLDKITDVGTLQDPLMRLFGLHKVTIETAGQSSAGQSLVSLLGVKDSERFREQVLEQRDRITERGRDANPAPTRAPTTETAETEMLVVLKDIRSSLQRLEQRGRVDAEPAPRS